jgi:hydrogenase maturation protease
MTAHFKILGLGDPYDHDNAIGLELVRLLSRELPVNVLLREVPCPGVELLQEFLEATPIIFITAMENGQPVGDVTSFRWGETLSQFVEALQRSTNSESVFDVIALAKEVGYILPPIYFIGVSVCDAGAGEGLSAELARKLPSVLKKVRKMIASIIKK